MEIYSCQNWTSKVRMQYYAKGERHMLELQQYSTSPIEMQFNAYICLIHYAVVIYIYIQS